MSLPTVECFRGLDLLDQAQAIYEALYTGAGDSSLTPPECFKGRDPRDQLTDLYSALLALEVPSDEPVPANLLMDMEQGVVGSLVTLAMLENSTHGGGGAWEFLDSDPDHTFVITGNLNRRVPFVVDAVEYSGAGTKALYFDLDLRYIGNLGIDVIRYQLPAGHTDISVNFQVEFGADRDPDGVGDVRQDHVMITAGSNFCVLQQFIASSEAVDSPGTIRAHSNTGVDSNFGYNIAFKKFKHYSCTLRMNTTTSFCELVVLDGVTGEFVGASRCAADGGEGTRFTVQDYLTAFGGYTTYDNIAIDWTTAAFPMEPFILPPVGGLSVSQSSFNELTVFWTSKAFSVRIERSANGGPFVTIQADLEEVYIRTISSYMDTTVSDGVSYVYRVTALINEHESISQTFTPVVVDNATFLSTERLFILDLALGGTSDQGSAVAFKFTSGIYPPTITRFTILGNPGQYAATTTVEVRLVSDDSVVATRTINLSATQVTVITDVADIALLASTAYYLFFPTLGFNTMRNVGVTETNVAGGIVFNGLDGFPNAAFGPLNFYYTLSAP